MDESLPYRVSYSLGNEKCEKCRRSIGKDYIQIAIMVQVFHCISVDFKHCLIKFKIELKIFRSLVVFDFELKTKSRVCVTVFVVQTLINFTNFSI